MAEWEGTQKSEEKSNGQWAVGRDNQKCGRAGKGGGVSA